MQTYFVLSDKFLGYVIVIPIAHFLKPLADVALDQLIGLVDRRLGDFFRLGGRFRCCRLLLGVLRDR